MILSLGGHCILLIKSRNAAYSCEGRSPGRSAISNVKYLCNAKSSCSRNIYHFHRSHPSCILLRLKRAPNDSRTDQTNHGNEDQGRWNCKDLIRIRNGGDFIPTEDNAMKIDTWNSTGGHVPTSCLHSNLKLGTCAVNCYAQWFSGACPEHNATMSQQYRAAMAMLLRYNFIVVLEWMSDPNYVSAVEDFFGVPGMDVKRAAYCERTSHIANSMVPLVIRNDTMEKLIELNEVDISLYRELTSCLDHGEDGGVRYSFPAFDADRFNNLTRTIGTSKKISRKRRDRARKKRPYKSNNQH